MPERIFLIGMMGSGKSTVGKLLAAEKQIPFTDLDQEIEKSEGKPVREIFALNSESYFRQRESEILQNLINSNTSIVIACGGGTPCFHNNLGLMKKSGKIIYLECSLPILVSRLEDQKTNRPILNTPGSTTKEILETLLLKRKSFYELADFIIDADSSPESLAKKISAFL